MAAGVRESIGGIAPGMSATYCVLYYHVVFGTRDQTEKISDEWRGRLLDYLCDVVKTLGGTAIEAGGISDHVHLLMSLKPGHQLSDVVADIKRKSIKWVHHEIRDWSFGWQDGFAAFTVSQSNLDAVRKYIAQQEAHHRTRTFREEYVELLQRHGIEFDAEHLW